MVDVIRPAGIIVVIAVLEGATLSGGAVVLGDDDRVSLFTDADRAALNPSIRVPAALAESLRAVGEVRCNDGTSSTGFLVDVSSYVRAGLEPPVIIATVSHAFFDSSGATRGPCWFRQTGWEFFRLTDLVYGRRATSAADEGDWAFARVATTTASGKPLDTRFRLKIAFGDEYDFQRPMTPEHTYLNVSYVPKLGMTALVDRCSPDDKRSYRWFGEDSHDWQSMVIHDCDFLGAGSGGPFLTNAPGGGLVVIGVNVGDADPSKKRMADVVGVVYDPPLTHNYSRRFDGGLEAEFETYLEALLGSGAVIRPEPEPTRHPASIFGRK